jgi:hypothetical protein
VDSDKASMHNDTARSRVSLGFGTSFNITFLRESGGIFAHSREKNKKWDSRHKPADRRGLRCLSTGK